ncbi:hypothetical protein HID58_095647 [Brassica napus]|uniref:Uncharacterized protein n=1 Tax=Brassica napus TaxID=3708 RepID=A0ABQ7X308_BRANA|nr:hypothetical protein HID58_095647 [Brassica napus]
MAMKSVRLTMKSNFVSVKFPVSDSSIDCGLPMKNMCVLILVYAYLLVNRMIGIGLGFLLKILSFNAEQSQVHFDSKSITDNSLENMLGTPTDVANVYVLTIPPNRVAMLHRAPCLHQEFSLTRMCLQQLITSLGWLRSEDPYVASMFIALEVTKVETLTIGNLFNCMPFITMDPHHEMATPQWLLDTIAKPTILARCKNHLCRSVTADIKGEQLPGPIVTCNSAFGETFYIGSSSGGSVPANDSEVEQEAKHPRFRFPSAYLNIIFSFFYPIHRSDYLYKGTALHLTAQIAILDVAGYCFPSVYQCLNCWSPLTDNKSLVAGFDQKLKMSFNHKVIFRTSDGGTTHKETLQLLMNLGTYVAQFTVEDGTTTDLIGAKSTILHYASCGGDMSPMLNQINNMVILSESSV